ncbi:hypothetical protein DENIS_0653 [Desulfonema ishimotonii]|uniref:Nitrate reductase n=1 Tax=Desulfonema ishimotonii TaxID=45657 RepID=A0A401FRW4_9BACT|nr:hypothetical protein [Desulfonema ishimotonii]GBC59712.1 hypothetical protein DENIS_0653 [Desulfonema ishimotonii]
MYDFLIGPMLAISLVVFLAGISYRIRQFYALSEEVKIDYEGLPQSIQKSVAARETNEYVRINSARDILLKWKLRLKQTLLGKAPFFSAITIVFHTLLIVLPLVTVAHSILLDNYFSISLPTWSEPTVDTLTFVFILLFAFFFLRRIFVARVRSVTTYRDYIALFATGLPFITGYMAFHHMFDYQILLYTHIICGELMLIAIPFTKLAHMPFFVLSRFLIRNELTIGSGTRKWIENI